MEDYIEAEMLEWFLSTPTALSTSSSSSSSSSSEDEVPKKIPKINNFVEVVVPSYSEGTFREHFRMSRSTVNRLIERFGNSEHHPKLPNKLEVSAEKSVYICLWYLANKESFRTISDRFNVSLSSSHRILIRVINFILSIRGEYIKWPNNDEKKNISREFSKKQDFKKVVGCIDGSHIKINRPKNDEEVYVNRKGYHSLLLQGVVNHKKLFLDVYCGEPGSLHDARLLRKSSLYRKAAEDPNFFNEYYLLGDSAYPTLNWLVTPFRDNGALTNEEKQFNFKLSSTRMVVEHAFGLLKNRFRRLGHFENLNIKIVVKCIMASCILHNMCIIEKDTHGINEDISEEDNNPTNEPLINEFPLVVENRRNQIFEELFHN